MKHILAEDVGKFLPLLQETIKNLGNGAKKTEYEVELSDTVAIANVKGYWVGKSLIRIDIRFRD